MLGGGLADQLIQRSGRTRFWSPSIQSRLSRELHHRWEHVVHGKQAAGRFKPGVRTAVDRPASDPPGFYKPLTAKSGQRLTDGTKSGGPPTGYGAEALGIHPTERVRFGTEHKGSRVEAGTTRVSSSVVVLWTVIVGTPRNITSFVYMPLNGVSTFAL